MAEQAGMAEIAQAARQRALPGPARPVGSTEPVLADLTRLAAQLCDTPMALISLAAPDGDWLVATYGVDEPPEPTAAANLEPDRVVAFSASERLVDESGTDVGALCVLDVEPRELTARQQEHLATLARQVSAQLTARRQAAELAQSQQTLESLLHHTSASIYAKDLDGRYVLGNRAFAQVVGHDEAEILGRSDHDLFPPLIADQLHANDLAIALSGREESFTEQVPTGDGRIRDYLSTKFPLRTPTGDIYAVAGVSTDVTDLVEERREHAESEQRWRSLVENSPGAVAIITADGAYAYANPRAAVLYGVSSARAMVGRAAGDFIAPDLDQETRELFHRVLGGELVQSQPWALRRATGEVVDVMVNATRVTYDGVPAVQLALRDITAQATATRALRESERSWRTLFDASPVGIGLSDEHGHFVAANAALCALLGRRERDVIGHSSAEFTHPDDLGTHRDATRLIEAATDGVLRIEKRYVRPSGAIRWAWLSVTHTPGPQGQTWTLAHVQDVTERKAAERATLDSEANLKAVAGVIQRIQSGADARQTIVDAGLDLAQAGFASLVEPIPNESTLVVTASTHSELLGTRTSLSDSSVTAEVFRTGRAIFLSDPAENPLVSARLVALTSARSMLVVPVRSGSTVLGVLIVAWAHRVTTLDDRRASVVTMLADQAGVALRQASLVSELESLALTDPLTGLPNRRNWDQHLAYLFALASRDGRPLTIALADFDHFKTFNDTRGHQAGDELLKTFALAVRSGMRAVDTIARWGGEEFAISLPNCGADDAGPVLDRVRALMPLGQTCSIGFATWDGRESPSNLLGRVDMALYAAKAGGRDQVRGA